jgi:hypothetical protein
LLGVLVDARIPTIWQVSGGGPPPYFNKLGDNVPYGGISSIRPKFPLPI